MSGLECGCHSCPGLQSPSAYKFTSIYKMPEQCTSAKRLSQCVHMGWEMSLGGAEFFLGLVSALLYMVAVMLCVHIPGLFSFYYCSICKAIQHLKRNV